MFERQYVEKDKRKENKVNNYNEKAISLTNNKSQTENLGWIYQIENRMGNDNKKGTIYHSTFKKSIRF